MRPPVYEIDPGRFHADPYPDLAQMQRKGPAVQVPQLGAVLITQRDAVFRYEKMVDVFSSQQPLGLMTRLMGENMMRKDGAAHLDERRMIFPTVSPKTVRDHWTAAFEAIVARALERLAERDTADLVTDYAMEVSGEALKAVTGLSNMAWAEMDRVSKGMIQGCANYAGDPDVEAECHSATASIDAHIDARLAQARAEEAPSLLTVMLRGGLAEEQVRANVKLAISGGQNEPRKAIAGTAWALLRHPDQAKAVQDGRHSYLAAFEEYARWISPIGMSPRRVARAALLDGLRYEAEERVFLMFGAANRDPAHFARPEAFDLDQERGASIPFGAGPHFCAGAWVSRALIGEIALPRLFERFPKMALAGPARIEGWAFRGPISVPVTLR
ncbi:MAG TPA: cytochrome P450 [Rhodobacteraceae bacterium]|mgnify:FL=1|jgi:cytochrome P450|nr:cytochrome P450 [Paracoccaceae bacterium]HBV55752.1 cytochrome P450 [Paracoccaceae bacterium]